VLVKFAEIVTDVSVLVGEGVAAKTGFKGIPEIGGGVNRVIASSLTSAGKAAPARTAAVKVDALVIS